MGALSTSAGLVAACPPEELWGHVSDLSAYTAWMGLVHDVDRLPDDERGPAWSVELRSRLGPLARSKRLRMVRTVVSVDDASGERHAVFERVELDGRRHAPWTLRVEVGPSAAGSRVDMWLTYGGTLWTGGILQRILDDAIAEGRDRLATLVSSGPTR